MFHAAIFVLFISYDYNYLFLLTFFNFSLYPLVSLRFIN